MQRIKMKTIIMMSLFIICQNAFCCDNCNVYLGVTPNDDRNSVSFMYRNRLMMGSYNAYGLQTMLKHAAHGNDPAFWGNVISEHFNTYELRAQFLLKKRWRTSLILPYIHNSQFINGSDRYELNGFGDPIVLQGYQLINPYVEDDEQKAKHRLEIGAGIKLPLGKINLLNHNERPNLDLQPGTGSLDYLGYVKYILKYKNFGATTNLNYKLNTHNAEGYRYGNTTNATLNLFYQTKVANFTFIPTVGANIEQTNHDFSIEEHFDTGGHVIFGQLGLKVFWKTFSIFGEFQKAVSNKLKGYTQLINKHKLNVGFAYNF
jgi:hypothetical protein